MAPAPYPWPQEAVGDSCCRFRKKAPVVLTNQPAVQAMDSIKASPLWTNPSEAIPPPHTHPGAAATCSTPTAPPPPAPPRRRRLAAPAPPRAAAASPSSPTPPPPPRLPPQRRRLELLPAGRRRDPPGRPPASRSGADGRRPRAPTTGVVLQPPAVGDEILPDLVPI
jgi:hypothetical protein